MLYESRTGAESSLEVAITATPQPASCPSTLEAPYVASGLSLGLAPTLFVNPRYYLSWHPTSPRPTLGTARFPSCIRGRCWL